MDAQVAKRFAQLLTKVFAGQVVTYKGDGKQHVIVEVFETGMLRIVPVGEQDLGIGRNGQMTTPDQVQNTR